MHVSHTFSPQAYYIMRMNIAYLLVSQYIFSEKNSSIGNLMVLVIIIIIIIIYHYNFCLLLLLLW